MWSMGLKVFLTLKWTDLNNIWKSKVNVQGYHDHTVLFFWIQYIIFFRFVMDISKSSESSGHFFLHSGVCIHSGARVGGCQEYVDQIDGQPEIWQLKGGFTSQCKNSCLHVLTGAKTKGKNAYKDGLSVFVNTTVGKLVYLNIWTNAWEHVLMYVLSLIFTIKRDTCCYEFRTLTLNFIMNVYINIHDI